MCVFERERERVKGEGVVKHNKHIVVAPSLSLFQSNINVLVSCRDGGRGEGGAECGDVWVWGVSNDHVPVAREGQLCYVGGSYFVVNIV